MNESADANSSSQLNCLRIRYIPETDVHRNNQRPLFAIVQRARRPHHLNEPRARCVSTGSRLLQPWYLEPDPNRDSHGYQSQGFFLRRTIGSFGHCLQASKAWTTKNGRYLAISGVEL